MLFSLVLAITVLQKQDEVDDKSHAPTYGTRGSPTGTSYTGRIVPHFPGEDFPQPLTALTTMETQSIYAVEDYSAGHGSHCGTTQASIYTLTAGAPPAREAHLMQLHAMRHYPLIDQYYFSQQEVNIPFNFLKPRRSTFFQIFQDFFQINKSNKHVQVLDTSASNARRSYMYIAKTRLPWT